MNTKVWDSQTYQEVKPFMGESFLLHNKTAERLYFDYARDLPIIDYHCHLPPDQIAQNHQFGNITEAWLDGDHYKWRAMRTLGIAEDYITGDKPPAERFQKWAYTVPFTIRNPLYQWTHLELKRYFGIDNLLSPASASEIYRDTSDMLSTDEFRVQAMLGKMQVEVVCTTDDPTDDLEHHKIMDNSDNLLMLPAFRPDKAVHINAEGFNDYIETLGEVSNVEIRSFDSLLEALRKRILYFDKHGCKLSDHGLEHMYAKDYSANEIDRILADARAGRAVNHDDACKFKFAVLYNLSVMYHEFGWVQQFHLGALRNNNTRMARTLGPDTGFDSIGDFQHASSLSHFLDRLDNEDKLAKTILYNLNPADNEVMATMAGNFNDGSVKGKVQYGSAWWFLDQKDGIKKQLDALSNMGLLSCFVGMLTDSRSFLSFPRHEYFRRILCNVIGEDVHNGELPDDIDWLGKIVSDICYHNARNYFEFHNQNS